MKKKSQKSNDIFLLLCQTQHAFIYTKQFQQQHTVWSKLFQQLNVSFCGISWFVSFLNTCCNLFFFFF